MKKILLVFLVFLSTHSIKAQSDLVITEIMYNTPSVDSAEYIEIYNKGLSSIDLTNYSFSTGVNYTFPNIILNAGEYFVITQDSIDFHTIYGYAPNVEWTSGSLLNTSESITIVDNLGNMMDSVKYDDGGPIWPTGTDGQGASIILCDINSDNNDGNNWIASTKDAGTTIGGIAIFASPGLANVCCSALTGTNNTTICAEDSITINGTIYYASQSTGTEVFTLANGCDSTVTIALNVLAPKTGAVNTSIYNNDNIIINGTTYNASNLSGIEVFTNVGPNGCDSTVTINLSVIPDLIITEIMYNTPSVDSAEFIEIYNNGSSSIDLTNYSFSTGVNYTFPNIILSAGEYFVVTLDSIDFYTIYGYAPDVEWSSGNLLNSSEAITIVDNYGNVVDSVNYDDGGVWPTAPDGNGASLILCDVNTDNNDGTNWSASTNDAGATIGGIAIFASPGFSNFCCTPLTGTHNETVCDGGSIIVNGTTYDSNNLTGTEVFTLANGCDSSVTVTLNVLPALTGNNNTTVCATGSVIINGTTYNAVNPNGTEIFTNVGPNNCDSTVTVALNVLPALTGNNNTTICANESIVINGNTYDATTSSGTEVFTNVGPNNCDSTVTVALNVLPALTGNNNTTICANESIVINGNTYDATTSSGTEIFTNVGSNNCDSTVTVALNVLPALSGNNNTTICANESIVINGNTYDATTSTGTEIFTNVGPNGCDSTVTVALNVLPALSGTHNETVCTGESIIVNGTTYDASNLTGTEVFTNVGPNGCDSTVTVSLGFHPAINNSVTNSGTTLTANQTLAMYRWLDCDNGNAVIPGETAITFTPTSNGNYAVEITTSCVDTSACENVMITGINTKNSFNGVNIYPNPTSNILNITLDNINTKANLTLTSVDGKIVYQQNYVSSNKVQVDMSNNSKGIYFLKVEANNQHNVYKVVRK